MSPTQLLLTGSLLILGSALLTPTQTQQSTEGQKLFAQKCASCHGAKGEGGKGYSRPLTGNLSQTELAKFIAQSMPPTGKKCTAPESEKLAAYAYNAFYSPIAQDRIRPARVSLARLTVRQFRNAVTDLITPTYPVNPEHGLRGEYFKGQSTDSKERVFERLDPEVNFDFGTAGPKPEGFDPHKFTIVWQGSIYAPDTGEYELGLKTDRSFRLIFNNEPKPLIDAWVKSGNDTEFHESVTLLGGHAYNILLVFTKSSTGVDDAAKLKGKPAPKAFVQLCWKRPNHTIEVIPSHFLYKSWMPQTFVSTSPFPPDDRSIGYERGNSVSKAWDEATTAAALEAANYVTENLPRVAGVGDEDPKRKDRLQDYCKRFTERAFRRSLTEDQTKTFIDKQFQTAPNVEIAVKRSILLTLISPQFLYREIGGPTKDAFKTAADLSFGLWDTLPDDNLRKAAQEGNLSNKEQIQAQAERMANDPRSWTKLREFLLRWLKVDEVPDIVRNPKNYPDFNAGTASDLRTSLEFFLEKTAWGEASDYREMLLSPTQFLNGRLAKLYGVNLPAEATFQETTMEPDQRAGVVTSPYLLSRFAYFDGSSPIHRGVLIARNLLGRALQPPPAAQTPIAASLKPTFTTRERVEFQTKPDACNTCHSLINPLGFTLEKFDAIGRIRSEDNKKPIVSTGSYQPKGGKPVTFQGPKELATYIADSDEAHGAFVEKLFQHLVKQPILAYGPQTLPTLKQTFAENRYSIRKLMVQIMVATAK